MAYKGMGGTVKVPKKIKTPVGTEEKLIYANDEEIEMLRQAGGSGAMTPYGGVRSYYGPNDDSGQSTASSSGGFNPSANYTDNTHTTISKTGGNQGQGGSIGNLNDNDDNRRSRPPRDNDNDNNRPPPMPRFNPPSSETREFTGENVNLLDLYDNREDLENYLSDKRERTYTETRTVPSGYSNSGQKYTVTITEKGDPRANKIPDDFQFKRDRDNNIIGWIDDDGNVQHDDNNQWHVDETGKYFFVGEDALFGAGGEGSTTIIDAEGKRKTVGARTYAQLLGYDEDLLQKAIDDRQARVDEMAGRQEYYGGVYNPGTGEFTGGLEQDYYGRADTYLDDYNRLIRESEGDTRTARLEIDRGRDLAGEQERLARDSEFYRGLQADTEAVQRDVRGYRGRIAELAEGTGSRVSPIRGSLYNQQSEQIDAEASAQKASLQQMMASRGISPYSPVAVRMLNAIDQDASQKKREARRTSLFDAMNIRQQEDASRSNLYAQSAGLTGAELGAIMQRGSIRGQRLGALGQAQNARMSSAGGYLGIADALMRQAGMQGAMSGQMFQRGSYFGQVANELNKTRMAEAMDRQYGQENKQSAGLSLQLSKYGMDKQADLAEKLAEIQANFAQGSGSGVGAYSSGGRRSLLGSLAGGVAGYFLGGGNPYAVMTGASLGGDLLKI